MKPFPPKVVCAWIHTHIHINHMNFCAYYYKLFLCILGEKSQSGGGREVFCGSWSGACHWCVVGAAMKSAL